MDIPKYSEEHISQIPALIMLMKMGFKYITPEQALEMRGGRTSSVLLEGVLKKWLYDHNDIHYKGRLYKFDESNISTAIAALRDLPIQEGYRKVNQLFYDIITLGKSFEQTILGDKKAFSMHFVDWQHPENNVYHVTDEYSVTRSGKNDTYRPDIVLFVNGMPMVIIECKKPSLQGNTPPVEKAIQQHIDYQHEDGIRGLYYYSNVLMALAVDQNSYGTTATKKEFWGGWREMLGSSEEQSRYDTALTTLKNKQLSQNEQTTLFQDRYRSVLLHFKNLEKENQLVTEQDKILYNICRPERLIDLMYNFITFDDGEKKIARYQQFFAIRRVLKRIEIIRAIGSRRGGVIWQTQGSGKSLTMVMLAQMIAQNIPHAKILLVTDRIDLDDQILDTFKKCEKPVEQAHTGTHLVELMEKKSDAVVTTLIHKFDTALRQIKQPLESPDIFILIDEGHRSQYGPLNVKMQQVLPNGCFIAFTGTPLMKKEKSTADKFGGIIKEAIYSIRDAVADKAVVPLLYEGRMNIFHVNEKPLNTFFDKVAEPLTDYGKTELKRKFSTMKRVNEADSTIYERAHDISEHFVQNFQGKFKGQLVAPSKAAAIKYKIELDSIGKVTSEVVISAPEEREGEEDVFVDNENLVSRFWKAEMDKYNKKPSEREKTIINRFKKQDEPDIIIVVDKLLTGFDAPRNVVLYLTRPLKEHTLLQAIARVNRVCEGKDFGYVIDYYGDNLSNLNNALATYAHMDSFDEEDIEGTLTDISEEIAKLPQVHSDLWDIFKTIVNKYDNAAYLELLRDESLRSRFYEKLSAFARLLKMALSSIDFANKTPETLIKKYKDDAKFFIELQTRVKWEYLDTLDLRKYENEIRKLIDKHLTTEGEVQKITGLLNIFDENRIEAEMEKQASKAAKADHIAAKMNKEFSVDMDKDSNYHKKLATLIQETIDAYRAKRISEAEYYQKMTSYEQEYQDFKTGKRSDVPEPLIDNIAAIAFYGQVQTIFESSLSIAQSKEIAIEAALVIEEVYKNNVFANGKPIVDLRNKTDLLNKVGTELGDEVYDLFLKYDITLDWKDIDTLVDECQRIAIANYK